MFGKSELSVVTVLVAYMGGLALGAAVIGRRIDLWQQCGARPGDFLEPSLDSETLVSPTDDRDATFGDIDNDGNTDLLVTYYGQNALYHNLGGGRFEEVTGKAGLPTTGHTF